MRLTSTGALMGLAALAFALAAMTSQSGLLVLLSGLVLGCLAVNALRAWQTLRHLQLVAPPVSHAEEKRVPTEPWVVHHTGRYPVSLIQAVHPAGMLFEVASLAAGEKRHVVPQFSLARRGVYHWKEVQLQTAHPFGLVRARRRLSLAGELVVFPALYPAESPVAAGYDAMVGGKHRGSRRIASGTHFAGVRPLQAGDAFKQIHWPSSAKGLGLMVKTYEEELAGRIAVLVDPGHSGSREAADACVRAAGSLLFAALDEGHHAEWIALGTEQVELVPPFSDGHELLDALARLPLTPGGLTPLHLQEAAAKISPRSALVLVVTTVNEAVVHAVNEWVERRRVVTVCVPAPARQWPPLPGALVWEYGEDCLTPAA
ncbi:DUF58 domain-containing protein [Fontisphaera persica]|uniref:DUF58 domain-containing protein n=1 Tax=Fontisphaera persica TaxID=2974023 RepID=UPI0024BF8961|nr:DUF58 domain-containing protein [Fontisphaera persica]WCJ59614.1 DUF58 domain-containing protein [Fontisphaera persica]